MLPEPLSDEQTNAISLRVMSLVQESMFRAVTSCKDPDCTFDGLAVAMREIMEEPSLEWLKPCWERYY